MRAERLRAEVVAANMANAETTRSESGGPYRRQHVVFETNDLNDAFPGSAMGSFFVNSAVPQEFRAPGGVHVAQVLQDTSAPLKRYDPGHPDADSQGYVAYPDINPLTEMVDLMGATRAYGLNASAVQAEKGMITAALEIAKG